MVNSTMGPTFVEKKFGEDQYNRRAFILRNYEIMEIYSQMLVCLLKGRSHLGRGVNGTGLGE